MKIDLKNNDVDDLTNRYTSIDEEDCTYDAAGNLTVDHNGYQYTYDYENRITKIEDDQQTLITEFDYDTQGRRIKVYDAAAQTTTLYYYSDNWQVLSRYNGGTLDKSFIYGNYIDEVLVMNNGTNDYFYIHDHLYSPTALLSNTGSVVERYEYDAYGKVTFLSPAFSVLSSSAYGNHILFTGREVDRFDNSSLTLQYNRNRYLYQYMGRWVSHDPLEYIDGMNLYEYVRNRSIISLDPFGEDDDVDKIWKVLACRDECANLINQWARAGCQRKCEQGLDEDMTLPDFGDIKAMILSLVPNSPKVEWELMDVPILKIPTQYGNIEVVMTGTVSTQHCTRNDNGQRALQRNIEVSLKATGCVGPRLEVKTSKNGPKFKGIINRCEPCKREQSSDLTFTLFGKAGAIISGTIAGKVQLYPKPEGGRKLDGKLSVGMGFYCGSEICGEFAGSVKESDYF